MIAYTDRNYTLPLNGEERSELLRLLDESATELHMERHRPEARERRERLAQEEHLVRRVLGRLACTRN
jgi:hypothetical protein